MISSRSDSDNGSGSGRNSKELRREPGSTFQNTFQGCSLSTNRPDSIYVKLELFGVVRLAAGVEHWSTCASSLGEALSKLVQRFPDLATGCINGNQLRKGFIANINNERFTTDSDMKLRRGDTILIMSADAGG